MSYACLSCHSSMSVLSYYQVILPCLNGSVCLFVTIYLSFCPPPFAKAGDIKTHLSVCPSIGLSVCHKNFNLAHIFWSIKDRALIFGMHDLCYKSFLLVPCCDLDPELLPTSRSNLLPGRGPQFFEYACITLVCKSLLSKCKCVFKSVCSCCCRCNLPWFKGHAVVYIYSIHVPVWYAMVHITKSINSEQM